MVKGNQAGTQKKIHALLDCPELFQAEVACAVTRDQNRRGRVEERSITVACCPYGNVDLSAYTGFAGVAQVFRIERRTIVRRTGELRSEQVEVGITSLSRSAGTPARLLGLLRGHWCIENKSHYVRDVTFGEDASQVRRGNVPEVLSAFRNVAIGLIRLSGQGNVARACRYFAAKPRRAFPWIFGNRTE
jgi:predicted transposase YbfD/YdcC